MSSTICLPRRLPAGRTELSFRILGPKVMIKGMWAKALGGNAIHAQLLLNLLQNLPNSNSEADLVENLSDDELRLLDDLIAGYGTIFGTRSAEPDHKLIEVLAKAHHRLNDIRAGKSMQQISAEVDHADNYARAQIELAFLSPTIQQQILDCDQPADLTLDRLISSYIPLPGPSRNNASLEPAELFCPVISPFAGKAQIVPLKSAGRDKAVDWGSVQAQQTSLSAQQQSKRREFRRCY